MVIANFKMNVNDATFIKSFQNLHLDNPKESYSVALKRENFHKNRYLTVLPYDFNRIVLSDKNDSYINASRIVIAGGKKIRKIQHLATQGPLKHTVDDFWIMIWQEKIDTIVMLTELVDENGLEKCFEYWQGMRSRRNYANFSVQLCCEEDFNDVYVVRKFLMICSSTGKHHRMVHFHFKAWPDKGIPMVTDFVGFYSALCEYRGLGESSLVHCSAGVGRTGTFLLIEAMLQRMRVGKLPKPLKTVKQLRDQRMCMVETEDQLVFACNFVTEHYKSIS